MVILFGVVIGEGIQREMLLDCNRAIGLESRDMGLLSRFTSRESAPVPDRLWRRAAFASVTAGDEVAVTYRSGKMPFVVPSFVVDFVQGCAKFRALETHVAEHAEKLGWGSMEVASLRSWLPRLLEAGLLISSFDLHAQIRANPAEARPGEIEAIGFPTGGDRVPLMSRALDSFIANTEAYGRSVEYLISDGSQKAVQRGAFRAMASKREVRVLYAGEEEKRRFAAELVKRGACSPEAVEFALFDPLGTGFTCGANRNAVLLHGAGRMVCSVDDDVVCRMAAPPEPRDGIALFATCDPYSRSYFADRESAREAAEFLEVDYLASNEVMLGRALAELLPDDPDALDVAQVEDELLHRIEDAAPRVRATFTGHFGDPGIPTSAYYLFAQGKNLERLTESEAHYRAALASRSVLTLTASRAIGDASVCPGMAMGLDHREVLPPFFPVLHAEDFIFGATLWRCCPDAVLGHLPYAIEHDPGPGKPILLPSDLSVDRRAVVFEFAHLMRRFILLQRPAPQASATARMQTIGRALSELGALPPADFRDFLRMQTLEHESQRLDFLERQLRENTDAPDFWRDDVQALIDHARDSLGYDDFDIPFDLKGSRSPEDNRVLMRTLTARFGAMLQEWPAMVEASRVLREEGRGMFV